MDQQKNTKDLEIGRNTGTVGVHKLPRSRKWESPGKGDPPGLINEVPHEVAHAVPFFIHNDSKKVEPSFRFHPTDVELLEYYLKRKLNGGSIPPGLISEVDVYKHEPWELPGLAVHKGAESFFFCPLDTKKGLKRGNRMTQRGYWKTTGKVSSVESSLRRHLGTKLTYIFYQGSQSKGSKTEWVMHEYRSEDGPNLDLLNPDSDGYVLCKVFRAGSHIQQLQLATPTSTTTSTTTTSTASTTTTVDDVFFPDHDEDPAIAGGISVSRSGPNFLEVKQGTTAEADDVSCDFSDSDSDSSMSELVRMLQKSESETGATSSSHSVSDSMHPHVTGISYLSLDSGKRQMIDNPAAAHLSTVVPDVWELFRCQAGDVIDSPAIKPYAEIVVVKCCYSPLILTAVGSALRAEDSIEEWRLVAQIQQSPVDTNDSINPHVKYCYDKLKAHDVKTCFLYSALLSHKQIHISVLAKCFINEGLLGGTTMAAYKKAKGIVLRLINASLLEANFTTTTVKMHDVIRNSALAILSSSVEGCQMFMRLGPTRLGAEQDGLSSSQRYLIKVGDQLKQHPPVQEWEKATIAFLMDNEFPNLPSNPNCPTLISLFLQRNQYLRVIPASFFDNMYNLTTLNLSKTRIRSLPNSLFNLKSLQALLIRDCKHLITLPSEIGQVKSLQVLDLQGTELIVLPDTVSELTSLKSLRVSFYGSVYHSECNKLPQKLIGDGIISSLRYLEELGMFVYPGDRRWAVSESNITKELTCLRLSSVHFHFSELWTLDYFLRGSQSWRNGDVTEFDFIVGHDFKRTVSLVTRDAESVNSSSERCLKFVNGENIPYQVAEVLKRAASFYLDHHLSVCYLSDFGADNIGALRSCILSDCPEVVAVTHEEDGEVILPFLEYLSLNRLWNLKAITAGRYVAANGSFFMLKCLSVRACPELSFVFGSSMVKNLPNLEELVIEDCVSLKHLVITDGTTNEYGDTTIDFFDVHRLVDDFGVLPSLKVLKLHYLPNFVGMGRISWPNVEYMSIYNCPRFDNLCMTTDNASRVKEVSADKAWWESLKWDEPLLFATLDKVFTQIELDDL